MPLVITAFVFAAFIFHIGIIHAQSAQDVINAMQDDDGFGGYGTNPYDTEDEDDGEMKPQLDADSVEEKPRRPLESYFFSDSVRAQQNFVWNINRDYNRVTLHHIDTTLTDFHIDYPFYKEGVGDMSLGGLGQASQDINFYDRAQYQDFSFAQPYDAYIFRLENAPFYNVKKPFTQMSYEESGQKTYREVNFNIIHAQNISPSTGFAIDYKSRGTKGQYQRQDTKNHNLAVTLSHTGRRYSIHGGYLNNTIKTEESGGVVGLWTVRDSVFEMPIGVPTKLADAEATNHYRNNSLFFTQSYGIPLEPFDEDDFSLADKTAFYIGHSFEYNSWNRVYSDVKASYYNERAGIDENGNFIATEDNYYYDNWYINPEQTRDSISERVISNRFFLQAQPWGRNGVVGVLDGGIGVDISTYSQFKLDNYLSGEYDKETDVNWFVYGAASGKYRKYVDWSGEFKIYPAGRQAGDMSLKLNGALKAYIRNNPIILKGEFSTSLQSASYWEENLFSNHFVFQDPLSQESETRFAGSLLIPSLNLEIGGSEMMVKDMIYYDTDSNVQQQSDMVSITALYLRKMFVLGGLHLDHKLLGQWTTDEVVAPLPDLSAFLSYYYDFWAVKNILRLQIGADARYTSKYYMPSYNPALSAFYNQREQNIGAYPYVDLFCTAKWKRMRIILKYQHINNGLFGNNEYFQVADYPMNPGLFKIGISWSFYD